MPCDCLCPPLPKPGLQSLGSCECTGEKQCPNSLFSSLKMGQVGRGSVIIRNIPYYWASQVALVVKNPPANAGDPRDMGLIPGLGRSPGEGHGNPLQCSCLENSRQRSLVGTVHGVAKRWTQLSDFACTTFYQFICSPSFF